MNEPTESLDDDSLSEDQRAIAAYHASGDYQRARSRRARSITRPRRRRWPDRELSPSTSFAMGLFGLSCLLLFFAIGAAALTDVLHQSLEAADFYLAFAMLELTFVMPAIVVFSFVVVVPMFWYGSVLLRFTLAALCVVPGAMCFAVRIDQEELVAATVSFLIVAALAVLIQMWSHWTLSHSREIDERLAPTGTRSIMELTVVTAFGCFALITLDPGNHVNEVLAAMSIAASIAVAVIAVLIAFLRPGRRNLFAASLVLVFALAGAFVLSGTRAFTAFGWAKLSSTLPLIVVASLYGLFVIAATMWLCVGWLRICGWICLNRDEERQARNSPTEDEWAERLFSEQPLGPQA